MNLMKAVLLATFLASCGASSPAPKRTSNNPSCASLQADASATLSKFVEENRACTQDSDCVTVGFGASCFDSCTRAIAADRNDAYAAMVTSVNSGSCATYKQNQCPAPIVPPCAPPAAPACHQGVCE